MSWRRSPCPSCSPSTANRPNSNTGVAVISLVSIVCGYVLLAALWYFVFREKARERRKKGSSD